MTGKYVRWCEARAEGILVDIDEEATEEEAADESECDHTVHASHVHGTALFGYVIVNVRRAEGEDGRPSAPNEHHGDHEDEHLRSDCSLVRFSARRVLVHGIAIWRIYEGTAKSVSTSNSTNADSYLAFSKKGELR